MSGGKREGKQKVLNNASFLPFLYLMLFIIFFPSSFSYFFLPAAFLERMQIEFIKRVARRPSNRASNYTSATQRGPAASAQTNAYDIHLRRASRK